MKLDHPKIYIASSWRNTKQPEIVAQLKEKGFNVYDFRHPKPKNNGFHWSDIDPNWKKWTPRQFIENLKHPIANNGFHLDKNGIISSDALVMVLPCGNSSHLEIGFAAGMGLPTIILLNNDYNNEPELMYKFATYICLSINDVINKLKYEFE